MDAAAGGLVQGASVQIHSLQASAEHNGARGKLEAWDAEKGRWGVRLGSGRLLGLKPANLTRLQDPTDEHRQLVRRCQTLRDAGEWQQVAELDSQAREAARGVRAAWPEGATAIYRNLAQAQDALRQYGGAIAAFDEVRKIAQEEGNLAGEGGVCGQIGRCYQAMGQFERAIEHHERRVAIAEQVSNQVSAGLAYGDLGRCFFALCDYDKASAMHEQSRSILEQTGNRAGVATTFSDLGDCLAAQGHLERAASAHGQALGIVQKEVGCVLASSQAGRQYAKGV